MTPEQKKIVKTTWEAVVPISEKAAELFYGKLFELDPSLELLFKRDMKEQGKKLMQMIGVAVHSLDRLDEVVPAIQELGKRHVDYGVEDEDYETVAKVLLWTLETGLGDQFTPEVSEAWTVVYSTLASTMKGAAVSVEIQNQPITLKQKMLVQGTWEKVKPISDKAAELFYGRLFELNPKLKPLFTSNTQEQGKKLMKTISIAVNGLDRLEEIVPTVQELGKRHVAYGVEDKDYDTVAQALLWTLEQGLGPLYTPSVEKAWTAVYTTLATVMKDAAAQVAVPEGPISLKQKQIVQKSWEKVLPISETAAELFYGKLFELDPSLKPLFKADIKEQGKKLMQMINIAVNGLDNLEKIVPAVQDLGKRHVGYGVTDEHYDTVATALLWTLEQGLGDDFTSDVKEAWTAVYTVLATTMKEAAATVVAQPKSKWYDVRGWFQTSA